MCWQAKISFLSFIPGTFIGNAAFYATECNGIGALLGLDVYKRQQFIYPALL